MVNYDIVVSAICDRIGNPFIVNMEDGYASWINPESQRSIVFCNWDLFGDDISTQCEIRIDSIPDNCVVDRVILNGLHDEELYNVVTQFLDIAIEQYGF